MPLMTVNESAELEGASVVVAMDAWVDAGSASTAVAALLADGPVVATFEVDLLYDYRARRPTLEISDGRPDNLTWPELTIRRAEAGDRSLLVLTGPEPDFRWRELAADLAHFARRYHVAEWITLGAIPAAVPHTRPVPVLGTESRPGLLRGEVEAGPAGLLRVPSAMVSVLDMAVAEAGVPALGYFAQVPHYVSGAYPGAALALLGKLERHLGALLNPGDLAEEAEQLRIRLDTATALDEKTRDYVKRLEEIVDESRLPSGEELIGEIERFLRERGMEPGSGQIH
ncbi:MAG TPA: PAC2 family protein [Candidatus Limnocylindrales bacterium]|nr:PAC2 family protein [Candidatus Limnocylindrales bacterium]